jgi:hypothetical protein
MHSLVFFALGVVGGCVHLQRRGLRWERANIAEALLLHIMFWSLGLGGLFSWFGHVFASDYVASYVGWPAGNPFQLEVGFANLAFALPGLLAFHFTDRGFRLATGLAFSAFLIGAGIVHVLDVNATGNMNPGNVGLVLLLDFVGPLTFWLLFAYASHDTPPRRGFASRPARAL